MLVDEIFIPHAEGTIRVGLDPRLTVFAGLPEPARARLVDLLVAGLSGTGSASVRVRDDEGEVTVLSAAGARDADGRVVANPLGELAHDPAALARAMVVRPGALGLPEGRPDPRVHAEWTALSMDRTRLDVELGALEAGRAERLGLQRELGDVSTTPLFTAADSVAAIGPRMDEILRRRAGAERVLRDEDAADDDRERATAEVVRCEDELNELAAADVTPMSAARRLILRRRAMLRSRIEELPTDADVDAARRRLEIAVGRLAELEEREPALAPAVAARVRTVLLARAAGLRPEGVSGAAPLVLDDPLVRLVPDQRVDLLDVIARVAERVQIVLLTDDDGIGAWARHRSDHGEVRLIDMTAAAAS